MGTSGWLERGLGSLVYMFVDFLSCSVSALVVCVFSFSGSSICMIPRNGC